MTGGAQIGVVFQPPPKWKSDFSKDFANSPGQTAAKSAMVLVAFQNNQRLLGYRPVSALHSCSPRCNRPPRANPNPERAEV